jgi:hypothetical protein
VVIRSHSCVLLDKTLANTNCQRNCFQLHVFSNFIIKVQRHDWVPVPYISTCWFHIYKLRCFYFCQFNFFKKLYSVHVFIFALSAFFSKNTFLTSLNIKNLFANLQTIDDSPYYVFVALCIVVIVVSLIKIAASNNNIECFREYFAVGYCAPDPSFFKSSCTGQDKK